jgi:hypothetical protein
MSQMNARYAGTCANCHGHFAEGTAIEYDRATRKAAHVSCPAVPEAAPARVMADVRALVAAAIATRDSFAQALTDAWEARKTAAEVEAAAYAAAGLCPTCMGAHSYEVRWSMDCGCTEWVTCDCAKGETKSPTCAALIAAVPAVAEAVAAYAAAHAEAKRLENQRDALNARIEALIEINKGDEVEVVKGRKVPKGTKGVVIWMGEGTSYGFRQGGWGSYRAQRAAPARLGVKDAEGTVHWTAASNVEVVARVSTRMPV